MLKKVVGVVLMAAAVAAVLALAAMVGTALAVPEGDAAAVRAAVPAAGEGGAADGEAKDPLQFGSLKMGLDALVRGKSTRNFNFSDYTFTPGNGDDQLMVRVRPSLTFTLADYLSARVEGQWYATYNDKDFDTIRLYQGYLEGGLPSKKVTLRAGRQELAYGSTFLLGADSFFDGLSYDAVKVGVKPLEPLSVDFFAGTYTRDNSGGITGELYGVYGTYAVGDDLSVDLYGLLDTGGVGLSHDGKDERTWSVGARLAGKVGKLVAFEVEPVFQFGRHVEDSSHHHIRAYGGHADLTIDPAIGRYSGVGFISYAFGSGDSDGAQGTFSEFHNPGNDTPLIGDMSVIGDLSGVTARDSGGNEVHASGLHAITIGGGVDVTEKVNVSLDGHYFRAVKTPAGISKDIGFETNLILTYKFTDQVSLLASANRFFTGSFFKDATGSSKDINYGYLQVQATF